jgi:dolichyl-phosphate beta-glucosyltransferase
VKLQKANTPTSLSIIVPVYNEEKRITRCLDRVLEFSRTVNWEIEVVIVEDGSTDRTAEIVKEYESQSKLLRMVSWRDRKGKGASIKRVALLSNKEYVCYMDADLAADPFEFTRLLKFKDEFDVVIGSRLLPGRRLDEIKRPLHRSFFSKSYSLAFRTLFRAQFYDPQCGFKLFRREAFLRIFENVRNDGYGFDSEVVIKALLLGFKVKEVSIEWKHIDGSKIKVTDQVLSMGKSLLSIWHDAYMLQEQCNMRSDCSNNEPRKLCRGELILRMWRNFLRVHTEPEYHISQLAANPYHDENNSRLGI